MTYSVIILDPQTRIVKIYNTFDDNHFYIANIIGYMESSFVIDNLINSNKVKYWRSNVDYDINRSFVFIFDYDVSELFNYFSMLAKMPINISCIGNLGSDFNSKHFVIKTYRKINNIIYRNVLNNRNWSNVNHAQIPESKMDDILHDLYKLPDDTKFEDNSIMLCLDTYDKELPIEEFENSIFDLTV